MHSHKVRFSQDTLDVGLGLGERLSEFSIQADFEGIHEAIHENDVGQSDSVIHQEFGGIWAGKVSLEPAKGLGDFSLGGLEFLCIVGTPSKFPEDERSSVLSDVEGVEIDPLIDQALLVIGASQQSSTVISNSSNIAGNGVALEQGAVASLSSRNLSNGEFGQEFGGFVGHSHLEIRGVVHFDASVFAGKEGLEEIGSIGIGVDFLQNQNQTHPDKHKNIESIQI